MADGVSAAVRSGSVVYKRTDQGGQILRHVKAFNVEWRKYGGAQRNLTFNAVCSGVVVR